MSTETETPIADLLGPIALREFEGAPEYARPKLEAWIRSVPSMDDQTLREEAESAIHASALLQSFRGNWEHEHCKASVVYDESKRRWTAAGHGDECRGSTIYDLAFRAVWIGQGHSRSAYPVRPCTCDASDSSREGH